MSNHSDSTLSLSPLGLDGGRRRAASDTIRVLVAHESRLVAEAFMYTIDADPGLEAIGYALEGCEGLELAAALEPDVVLVGPRLPGLDPAVFTRVAHMLWPRIRIVVLTESQVPHEVEEIFALGAADCLAEDRAADDLLTSIHTACARLAVFERTSRRSSALEPATAPADTSVNDGARTVR
jgi:DNA-binding NarL/FixJ family response regulator